MNADPIRVVIADDTRIAIEGMSGILATLPGLQLVGAASTVDDLMSLVVTSSPDIVFIDLKWNLDERSGIEAIGRIKAMKRQVIVIALTAYEDLVYSARVAGADAAMLKTFSREELLGMIQSFYPV